MSDRELSQEKFAAVPDEQKAGVSEVLSSSQIAPVEEIKMIHEDVKESSVELSDQNIEQAASISVSSDNILDVSSVKEKVVYIIA